ncbi:TPA: hypothetical protein I7C77_003433 [Vibrio cholerae]|nr:hypothetical protein [Vibrio cholerae]
MAAMINIFLYQEIKSLYRQSKAPFVMRYGCDQFRLRRDGIVFDDLSIAFKIERYFMTHPGRYLTRDQGWYALLLSWMPFLYILPIFDGMSVWKNGEVVRSYEAFVVPVLTVLFMFVTMMFYITVNPHHHKLSLSLYDVVSNKIKTRLA